MQQEALSFEAQMLSHNLAQMLVLEPDVCIEFY